MTRRRARSEEIRQAMCDLVPDERVRDTQALLRVGDVALKDKQIALLAESAAIAGREFKEETRMARMTGREGQERGAARVWVRTCSPPDLPASLQVGRDGVTELRLEGDFVLYVLRGRRMRLPVQNVVVIEETK